MGESYVFFFLISRFKSPVWISFEKYKEIWLIFGINWVRKKDGSHCRVRLWITSDFIRQYST